MLKALHKFKIKASKATYLKNCTKRYVGAKKCINRAITNEKPAHPNSLRFIFFIIQDYQIQKHDSM